MQRRGRSTHHRQRCQEARACSLCLSGLLPTHRCERRRALLAAAGTARPRYLHPAGRPPAAAPPGPPEGVQTCARLHSEHGWSSCQASYQNVLLPPTKLVTISREQSETEVSLAYAKAPACVCQLQTRARALDHLQPQQQPMHRFQLRSRHPRCARAPPPLRAGACNPANMLAFQLKMLTTLAAHPWSSDQVLQHSGGALAPLGWSTSSCWHHTVAELMGAPGSRHWKLQGLPLPRR